MPPPPPTYSTGLRRSSLTDGWVHYSRFAKWKRIAEEWFRRDSEMFETLVESVRTKMVSGIEQVLLCLISDKFVRML